MTRASLESLAYHRAGLAVGCYLEGLHLTTVSIERTEEAYCHFFSANPLDRERLAFEITKGSRAQMECLVRVCLAGRVAQRRLDPENWQSHHGATALHTAVGVLSRYCVFPEEVEACLDILQLETERKLRQPGSWQAVEAVAEALLKSKTLDGVELREIIREAIRQAPHSSHEVLKTLQVTTPSVTEETQ